MSKKDNIDKMFQGLGDHRVTPPKMVRRKVLMVLFGGGVLGWAKQYWLKLALASTVSVGAFVGYLMIGKDKVALAELGVEQPSTSLGLTNQDAPILSDNNPVLMLDQDLVEDNKLEKESINKHKDGFSEGVSQENGKKGRGEKLANNRVTTLVDTQIPALSDQNSNKIQDESLSQQAGEKIKNVQSSGVMNLKGTNSQLEFKDLVLLDKGLGLRPALIKPFLIETNFLQEPLLNSYGENTLAIPKVKKAFIQSLSVGLEGSMDWVISQKDDHYQVGNFAGGGFFVEAGMSQDFFLKTGFFYHQQRVSSSFSYQEESIFYETNDYYVQDSMEVEQIAYDSTFVGYILVDSTSWQYDSVWSVKADTSWGYQYSSVAVTDSVLKREILSRRAMEKIKNRYFTIPLFIGKSFAFQRHQLDVTIGTRFHFLTSKSNLDVNPYYDVGKIKNVLLDYSLGLTYGYNIRNGLSVFVQVKYSYWQNAWLGSGTPITTIGGQVGLKYRLR